MLNQDGGKYIEFIELADAIWAEDKLMLQCSCNISSKKKIDKYLNDQHELQNIGLLKKKFLFSLLSEFPF